MITPKHLDHDAIKDADDWHAFSQTIWEQVISAPNADVVYTTQACDGAEVA
jgi:hypothetical protein